MKDRLGKSQQVFGLEAADFNSDEQEICTLFNCVPTDFYIAREEKRQNGNYTVEKSSNTRVVTVNLAHEGQMGDTLGPCHLCSPSAEAP